MYLSVLAHANSNFFAFVFFQAGDPQLGGVAAYPGVCGGFYDIELKGARHICGIMRVHEAEGPAEDGCDSRRFRDTGLKALVHASRYLAKFPMAKDGACLRIALPMHWERMLA